MEEINEIKIPKGVDRIAVKQHEDRIVFEFIPEKPKFKEGDFVYEDGRIMIVKDYPDNYYALIYPKLDMKPVYNGWYALTMPLSSLSFRCATEDEKQLLIDAMKKDGKRWDAEKLTIEDIPQPKFKTGDKVRIKKGVNIGTNKCDELILTVDAYYEQYRNILYCKGFPYLFHEDWLEPYIEELKKGDLAIFWDNKFRDYPLIRMYDSKDYRGYYDSCGIFWDNAIKFESKEQYEKVLRGEIN